MGTSKTPTKFIILATPRSGSSYLVRLLRNHPQINCHGEVFKPQPRKNNKRYKFSFQHFINQSFGARIMFFFNPKKYLSDCINHLMADDQVFGFKIMYKHLMKYKPLVEILEEEQYKIIVLTRKNSLKQVVSLKHAMIHNIWNTRKKVASIKIRIDKTDLFWHLEDFDHCNQEINKLFVNLDKLELTYEDLFGPDGQKYIHKICDFLNVHNNSSVSSPLIKVLPDQLNMVVENYDELQEFVKNTKFERYLAD